MTYTNYTWQYTGSIGGFIPCSGAKGGAWWSADLSGTDSTFVAVDAEGLAVESVAVEPTSLTCWYTRKIKRGPKNRSRSIRQAIVLAKLHEQILEWASKTATHTGQNQRTHASFTNPPDLAWALPHRDVQCSTDLLPNLTVSLDKEGQCSSFLWTVHHETPTSKPDKSPVVQASPYLKGGGPRMMLEIDNKRARRPTLSPSGTRSKRDDLLLRLPAMVCLMKYFCAWLATWVGVFDWTKCFAIPLQFPYRYVVSHFFRNDTWSTI